MNESDSIEIRTATTEDLAALQRFLSNLGWGDRVDDTERLRAMLRGADRTVVALDGGVIVGFARALCDGASNGYISMVGVAPGRRRQGIGRALVERLCAGDDGRITWVLRAGRGSRGFWERLGFTASSLAMERVRQR